MKVALFTMTAAGIAIGLALPRPTPAPAPVVAAVAVAAPVTPAPKPVETVLGRAEGGHFVATADVNDAPVRFVVDTGADTVVLTQEDARRAQVDFDPAQFVVVGRGASGPVRGQQVRLREVSLDGKRAIDVGAVVLESSPMSLLGQTYLRKLNEVRITGDTMRLR